MPRRGWQGWFMTAFGAQDRELEVTAVTQHTPLYRRITFFSKQLVSEREYGPGAWLRLWLPAVDGSGREFQRAYTMIEVEPETGRFAIDFLLHSTDGPGSAWARQAAVGDRIAVQYYGGEGFQRPELEPAGWLLVADEASLPAANAIVESLPDHLPIDLVLYCEGAHLSQLPVVDHPQLRVVRVAREQGVEEVVATVAAADRSDWFAWIVIEAADTKRLRLALNDMGFPKASTHYQAYWVRGKEMGTTRAAGGESQADRSGAGRAGRRSGRAPRPGSTKGRTEHPRRAHGRAGAGSSGAGPEDTKTAPRQPGRQEHGVWRSAAGARLLAPLRPFLTYVAVAQLLASLLEFLPLLGLSYLATRLAGGDVPANVTRLIVTLAVLGGVGTLLTSLVIGAGHVVDAGFSAGLRRRLVAHLRTLPLGWFDRGSSGRVQQAVEGDSSRLHVLTTHAVPDIVAAAVPPVVILLVLLWTHAGLTLLLLLPVAVAYVSYARMYYTGIDDLKKSVKWLERVKTRAAAFLSAIQVDRLFPTPAFADLLEERQAFFQRLQRPTARLRALTDIVVRPATVFGLYAVVGVPLVMVGALGLGRLVPFLVLAPSFGTSILGLLYTAAAVREANAAARRIGLLLEEPPLAPPVSTAPLPLRSGRLRFESVTFGYHPRRPVIRDLSLDLEPGTVTALVGRSGAGKSTVAALAARLHDPQGGVVTLDGRPLADYPASELGRRLAFVFQQPKMLDDTVAANLRLARPDATDADLTRVLDAAQLTDVIAALPDGLATRLGGTFRLSGGETQRLAIARLLLTNPDVIVLDEATAYADPESEALMQRAITELVAGRTVLVIAHRLQTIANAHQIVVVEDGVVAERGTHSELLGANGIYARLWGEAGVAA